MKRCAKCHEEKALTEFYRHTVRGHQHWCKKCCRAYEASRRDHLKKIKHEWYLRNKEAEIRKSRLRKYGLTEEALVALVEAQDGQCAGCASELREGHWQHIDHCHETGQVRGVLCRYCNTALGFFREDPEKLIGLAQYAEERCGAR